MGALVYNTQGTRTSNAHDSGRLTYFDPKDLLLPHEPIPLVR